MLAAVGSARTSARQAQCVSNLRQIGLGIHLYANDHRGYAPESRASSISPNTDAWCDWLYQLRGGGYISNYEMYGCVSDSQTRMKNVGNQQVRVSYGINETLANPAMTAEYRKLLDVARPSVMPLAADSTVPIINGSQAAWRARVTNANGTGFTPGTVADANLKRHRRGSVVCFVMGTQRISIKSPP